MADSNEPIIQPDPSAKPPKPEPTRPAKMLVVLGYNGTGKTTFVKKLVAAELQKPSGRALIVTPDDMEWNMFPLVHPRFPHRIESYVKARRIIFDEYTLQYLSNYSGSEMLVFDDCRAYLGSVTDQELHQLLIRRRQRSLDIVAVGHGFTEVPPKFFTFASHIVLFRTIDNIKRRENVLKDYEAMKQAQERINQAAERDPHYFEIIPQV